MNKQLTLFLKGFSIGFCDIIPGVSGGTIALITGIYSKFIGSLKNLNVLFIFFFVKYLYTANHKYLRLSKENFDRMNPKFLIVLFSGVFLALILASFIMPYFMNNFPVFTYSLFFGLILTSAVKLLKRNIEKFHINQLSVFFGLLFNLGKAKLYLKTHSKRFIEFRNFMVLIVGFILGLGFADLSSLGFGHSYLVLFFSGFCALCAMLLPGISGSYVLLILGQYEYVLSMLHNLKDNFLRFGVFSIGAISGVVGFSKVISFLLKRYYRQTIFFLVGLMIGTLKLIVDNILKNVFNNAFLIVVLFGVLLGSLVVFLLDSF